MDKIFIALIAAIIANQAAAETDKALAAEIELGVITTTGNTETQSYTGKLDITQDLERWKNNYVLQGLFKRDQVTVTDAGLTTQEKQTTAEKYFGSVKSDYKIDKKHGAFFGYAEYDRDRFSGFDYQYTVALGYSDRFFSRDNSYLAYDIGPGYTVNRPEELDGVEQEEEDSFILRVAAEYLYEFSENAKFTQKISSNINVDSDENTKTRAISALTAKINGALSLRASFTIDYNSEVPEEVKHADTETALTIVYSL